MSSVEGFFHAKRAVMRSELHTSQTSVVKMSAKDRISFTYFFRDCDKNLTAREALTLFEQSYGGVVHYLVIDVVIESCLTNRCVFKNSSQENQV